MKITIFKELTTSEILQSFSEKAEKYTDLYVDMNNADERRFIKGHAEEITGILKKLDRARIDKTKASKKSIDEEFNAISESLKESNKPFTLLVDAYKAERKRILDEDKAVQARKDAYFQMGIDHTDAINENDLHDLRIEKYKTEQANKQREWERTADQRAKQELEAFKASQIALEEESTERERAEKAEREANLEHVTSILSAIKCDLMQSCGIDAETARAVTLALKNNLISHTLIKF